MDIIVHHYSGAKDVVKEDVIDLIGKHKIVSEDKFSIVRNVSEKDLATLSFLLQSAIHVGVLLAKGNLGEDIESSLSKLNKQFDHKNLAPFLDSANSFAIRTVKDGDNSTPSPDISSLVGDWFSDLIDKDLDVNLSRPDIPILAVITDKDIVISLDVIGFPLTKRPYKIALHAGSLNGVVAYTISRLSGVKRNSIVLDPFCGGGTIPIEVASYKTSISSFPFENKFSAFRIPLLKKSFEEVSESILNTECPSDVSTFGFDNMLKVVKSAQKNAKLSGVFSALSFSKVDVEWVDSKFEEGEVDVIITNPPQISNRNQNHKQIKSVYDDLFYQAKYLLNKKGILAVLLIHTPEAIEMSKKHGFKEIENIPIQTGGQTYSLIKFKLK